MASFGRQINFARQKYFFLENAAIYIPSVYTIYYDSCQQLGSPTGLPTICMYGYYIELKTWCPALQGKGNPFLPTTCEQAHGN